MIKEHDYFLELMSNPTFSPRDFQLVGLNSKNTGILDKAKYKNSLAIQDNIMFQTNGKFDEGKFDKAYEQALYQYNDLARLSQAEKPFFRDDIFAPKELRGAKDLEEFKILKVANPLRQKLSFVNFGILEEPTMSVREIAESNPVFDYKTGTWSDSPNETWFDNFINPKVLALWDFDADENGNPTSDPEKVIYHKGEKKINPETGTYYYETLGNRDIYGREVLSGFDTLTTDGSVFNKYDFFDSDDREKSLAGSLTRAVALIAPVFIPYVGEAYIGTRIGLSMALLIPTVGKIFTGSDNSFLSKIEGINQAFSFSTSDRTKGSQEAGIEADPWTMETGLKLISDVFTLLAEQRWIFKYGTALFSKVNPKMIGETEEAVVAREAWIQSNAAKQGFSLEGITPNSTQLEIQKIIDTERTINYLRAKTTLDKTLKHGQELSKHLSMAYMTGITTADSYGEAKQQGASDVEAALFALGYTAGEYALLSSDLGLWILPELKMEKFQNRQIAKALSKVTREAGNVNEPTGVAKLKWYKLLFNYGKLLATLDYSDSVLASASKMTVSSMLSEGIEETSEEALLDISKTLFNAANALRGDDTRFDDAWKDMATRYGMSFIGGTVGGGIATALPGYKAARSGRTIKDSEAYKHLVNIVQNGQAQEFIDTVNKMELGNRDLSMVTVLNSDGTTSYKPAERYEDSQDFAIKQKLIEQVNIIDNILSSEGAKISDDSLLNDKLIRKELKYHSLLNSNILGVYTNEFNNLLSDLIDVTQQVDNLEGMKSGNNPDKTDEQNRQDLKTFTKEDEKKLSDLKKQQKEFRDKLEMYRNGSMANEFIGEALFEMDSHISAAYAPTDFIRWAEEKSGKKFTELSDTERGSLEKEWKDGSISRRESIHRAYQVFKLNLIALSNLIKKFEEDYFVENKENAFRSLETLFLGDNNYEATLAESADVVDATSHWIPVGTREAIWNGLLNSIKGSVSELEYNQLRSGLDVRETYESYIGISQLPQTVEELNNLPQETKDKLLADLLAEETPKEDKDLITLINTRKNEFTDLKALDFISGWSSFIANPIVQKEFISKLKEAKYLTPTTKQYIRDFVNRADVTEETVKELNDTLNSIGNSPIEELLTNMKATLQSIGVDTTGMITDLAKFMSDLANSANIENFSYSELLDLNIRKTLDLIEIAHSHIEAAKTEIYGDLNNFFGYNASINELQEKYPVEGLQYEKLVELKSDTANSLMHELAKIYNDLKFYQAIYNANTNAKLTDHIKTDLKVNSLYFGNLKSWSTEIPDDWEGKDKINEAISNATTLQSVIDNKKESLSLDERKQIFQEKLNIDLSIYDFFLANKEKLKDVTQVTNLIKSFNLLSKKSSILNSGSEVLDNSDFIWNLASIAASNPTAVYNEYKNSITGKYAPIIAQEEAIRRAYSYILNPKMFEIFGQAYNEVYKEQLQAARLKDGKTQTDMDTDEYLMSIRHFLIEGIPGSGKTSATFTMLHNMLKLYHPELLKKVWFVSNSNQNADNASSEIGIEGVTTMSKEEYFNKIANNYSLKYDSYGVIDMSASDVEEDENGINHYKNISLNEGIEAPSLIFFDEISSFSQLDLLLSEDFLKAKGIYALAAGDFDLIGALGKFQDINGEDVFVRLANSNFIGSWKLGSSMRSNNTYKSKNISVARESIKEFPKIMEKYANGEGGIIPIKFAYYEALDGQNKGLYGDKVVRTDEPLKWEQSVKNMLDSLKDNEKLNFISDDPSTDLYLTLKALNEGGQYKGKINFVQAGASLGLEGLYYVIELGKSFERAISSGDSEAAIAFGKTIYTTISRAKQGSLIVGNYDADTDTSLFQSIPQTTLQVNNLSPQILLNFAKERIRIIENAIGSSDAKTELIRDTITSSNSQGDSTSGENPSGDDITEEEVKINNLDRPNKIENTKDGELNLMMHSFMCQETGCNIASGSNEPTDSDTLLKLGRYFDKRIDNLNGLAQIDLRSNGQIKLPNVLVDLNGVITLGKEDLLRILNRIRNLSCYIKDKNELIKAIQNELGTTTPIKINFAYKNQYRSYKSEDETKLWFDLHPDYQKFYKGKDEYLAGIFNESNQGKEIREPKDQVIEAIITLTDGTLLMEIPLCKITSPLTLLNTSEFEGLKLVFDSVGLDVTKFKKEVKRLLQQNSNIPHIKEYAMLLELYEGSAFNTISYFANDFILAKVARVTGITTTSTERGEDYFKTLLYYYDGKWMSLEDYKERMPWRRMSKIFTSVQQGRDVISINGKDINVGKPFVLVSDYYSDSTSDLDLLRLYLEQLNNPNSQPLIRLVYVTPPSATILEYVFNLNNALTKHKGDTDNIDRDLGTKVTAFRLLQFALADNSQFRTAFTNWINSTNLSNKEDFLKRLDAVSEIVKFLGNYESLEGKKKLYDLLNTPIRSLNSNVKGLLKYSDSTGDKWLMASSSNLTLRHVLQQELHKMLLSDLFYGDSLLSNMLKKQGGNIVFPDKVKSKIDAFVDDVKKGGWNGVQYHLKLKNSRNPEDFNKWNYNIKIGSQELLFAEIDTEYNLDYSVSGKPVQINGKLDSTSFILDIVPFAKWVIKGGLGRDTEFLSTDNSTNIFSETTDTKKLKDINTSRYLNGEPAKDIPTEDKSFSDLISKAKFPRGMKLTNSKNLGNKFKTLTQQLKQLVLADPRLFIYDNTNEHLIAHNVNGELKLFNFGNTQNIVYLSDNIIFQISDDLSKVYKLDSEGKAIPLTKEEFIQMIQGLRPSTILTTLLNVFPEDSTLLQEYIDKINNSNDHREVDAIYTEALLKGIKEEDLMPIYTKRHYDIDNGTTGDLLILTTLDQLVANAILTPEERANTNIENNIQFLTNPRNIQSRLSSIFTKDRTTGKWVFKDASESPSKAVLVALVGFGKYRLIMNNPDLQGIITSFDKNLENYILLKMQEHENDSCSFSRFGGF